MIKVIALIMGLLMSCSQTSDLKRKHFDPDKYAFPFSARTSFEMDTMYKDVESGKYLALDSNTVVSIFPDSLLRRNWSSDGFYLYSKQASVHGFSLFSLIHHQYAIGYYLKLVLLSPENEFIASSIVAMRAGEGGASADAHTTFLNDSVYVVTTVYGETDFDSSGRTRIDSVISTFIIRPSGFSQIEKKQFDYMR